MDLAPLGSVRCIGRAEADLADLLSVLRGPGG